MKIYNTMSRKKEEFIPLEKGKVGLYTCGPTVYSVAHLGNLRAYIFDDILKRALLYNGFKVKHVMNITDVGHLTSDGDSGDDKIEKGATKENLTVWEIAHKYTEIFKEDIEKLNIVPPSIWCKATDHIKEQIALVQKLIDKGYTYETKDGIYFDTSKLSDYGKLARLDKEGLEAGKRVDLGEKKHPTDFALWKFSPKDKKRQMEWDAFGHKGFPGWHIECSAMSMKYLGETFDIHCGGVDHIPIHHTNDIAQAEAATGKTFVNYWMHNEFLVVPSGKMAKSEGNIADIVSLEKKGFSPLDYRYFCLLTHYRKQLMFSMEALEAAKNALSKLRNKIKQVMEEDKEGESGDKYEKEFSDAINDDLNIPKALGILWDMLNDEKVGSDDKITLVMEFDKVLGLDLDKVDEIDSETIEGVTVLWTGKIPQDVLNLAVLREKVRKEKKWKESDELREKIKEEGYSVKDTKEGPYLKKI